MMFSYFNDLDENATGYINLDAIYQLINEEPTSVVAPFIERFFSQIKKEYPDRISFIEFLPAVSAFCLFTKSQIREFVFKTIDLDEDLFLSKTDILLFLYMERQG
jgi:Ca2+-binding EF-hand superfamily protein